MYFFLPWGQYVTNVCIHCCITDSRGRAGVVAIRGNNWGDRRDGLHDQIHHSSDHCTNDNPRGIVFVSSSSHGIRQALGYRHAVSALIVTFTWSRYRQIVREGHDWMWMAMKLRLTSGCDGWWYNRCTAWLCLGATAKTRELNLIWKNCLLDIYHNRNASQKQLYSSNCGKCSWPYKQPEDTLACSYLSWRQTSLTMGPVYNLETPVSKSPLQGNQSSAKQAKHFGYNN